MQNNLEYEVGDVVEFVWCKTRRVGEIVDFSDNDDLYFIRIKSGEIFRIKSEDIKNLC